MINTTWSVFNTLYLEKDKWVQRTRLYMGDLTKVNITSDWRFNDVEGKRKDCEFLGLIDNPKFPLVLPIKTYKNLE